VGRTAAVDAPEAIMSIVLDHPSKTRGPETAAPRCKLCGCKLVMGSGDNMEAELCRDCKRRPAAAPASRIGTANAAPATSAAAVHRPPKGAPLKPRAFSSADVALIKSLHHLPAAQLLELLNGRHVDDGFAPFTREQLYEQWKAVDTDLARAGEWASLRKLLNQARRTGVLAAITPQLVDDFAIVFSLSPAQHMHVRDVIRSAQEER
jgi:hypothetical protein